MLEKNKKILIGALHLPPLLGYVDFPGFEIVLANAKKDLVAFQDAGFDAIIIENNYDNPHSENIDSSASVAMAILCYQIKQNAKIPVGISVLWNDYKAALSIAKAVGADFIRIPVFVDTVKTSYGIVKGNPKKVINFRKSIHAENVLIFTDIHVKHAKLLSKNSLIKSALLAIKNGSDGLIITGKWTGDEPSVDDLHLVREAVGDFPIIAGSGVDVKNIKKIFSFTNACIVSTSLKEGQIKNTEINLKGYSQRISIKKCRELVTAIK
ncbi:MAG: BtpA/SgcQ family protein [Candidatus Paceibacterota bacterium]